MHFVPLSKNFDLITVDWLSYTFKLSPLVTLLSALQYFEKLYGSGVDAGGLHCYDKGLIYDCGLRVMWSTSRVDMGIHVVASGSVLRSVGVSLLGDAVVFNATIKRIDIAFDDFSGRLDLQEIYSSLALGAVVTRGRGYRKAVGNRKIGRVEGGGLTVYVGTRSSDTFLRFYDKASEQGFLGFWVRAELEFKRKRAQAVFDAIVCFGRSTVGVLSAFDAGASSYLSEVLYSFIDFKRFPCIADMNKSRWSTVGWWLDFLDVVKKSRLSIRKDVRTIEDIKYWFENSIAPMLAVLRVSRSAGDSWLDEVYQAGLSRWHKKHIDLANS